MSLEEVKKRLSIGLCLGLTFLVSPILGEPLGEQFEKGYEAFKLGKYSDADSLWRSLAHAGHGRSQNALGVLYRKGLGVEKNLIDAFFWFNKSANAGNAYGMYNLSLMYRDGIGVQRDHILAYKWLYLATAINYDEKAKMKLFLLEKKMVEKDIEEAKEFAQQWIDQFFF